MNQKATIAAVLLVASLYGQVSHGSEVVMSQDRLASLNGLQIKYLANNDLIRFNGNQAILDLAKLETVLKAKESNGDVDFASYVRKACVPYGNT